MAIRNVAIPLLGGGAVLLGYAAFSWLRKQPSVPESNGPITLRAAGLGEPAAAPAAVIDTGPLSERVPELSEFFELELEDVEVVDRELAIDDEPRDEQALSSLDPPFHDPIGARFLARATDALSPFGAHVDAHFERERLDIDRFAESTLREAASLREAARAPRTDYPPEADEREAAAESERRPSLARTGVGS